MRGRRAAEAIRPRGTESAWWCADVVMRTGAFGLVIVDQAPAATRSVAVRLQRLARDKDAVMLARDGRTVGRSDDQAHVVYSPSVRLTVRPSESGFVPAVPGSGAAWPGPRNVRVDVEKGGAPRSGEVTVGLVLPNRLRPHWAVRDRRPGAASNHSVSGRGQRQRAGTPDWPVPRVTRPIAT